MTSSNRHPSTTPTTTTSTEEPMGRGAALAHSTVAMMGECWAQLSGRRGPVEECSMEGIEREVQAVTAAEAVGSLAVVSCK